MAAGDVRDGGMSGRGGGKKSSGVAGPKYVSAKVSVWWDIENCQVPKGFEAHMIAQNISSALVNMNYCGPLSISAYGDTTQINPSVQVALNSTGISLNHVPAGVKDASDKKILVDMLLWAVDNPAPANYLLISGDRDFSNALHQLGMRRYNILLAHPQKASVHLVAAAKSVWLWTSLLAGGPPLATKEVSKMLTNFNRFSSFSSGAMQTAGNSYVSNVPLSNQLASNILHGTDTNTNQGRPFERNTTQYSISSTPNAVSASHNGLGTGNPHESGYGIPVMTNNNHVYSCNPNSTVQIQGSNPFLSTYTQDGFPNNGSNHQGSFQNSYPVLTGSTSFHMQPTPSPDLFPPPPPSHFLSTHKVPLLPNTSTVISSPVACVPIPSVSKSNISEHSVCPVPQQPDSFTFTSGPVAAYIPDLSKLNINEHSPRLLPPQPASSTCTLGSISCEPGVSKLNVCQSPPVHNGLLPTPASTEGSSNLLTVNLPRKVYTVPKNPPIIKIKLSSKWSQSGQQNRPPVSTETCTTNEPGGELISSSGCPRPVELVEDLAGIVLALNTLKNEKIMPTEEHIADCLRYGDPKYRSICVPKALRSAVEQKLAVKQKIGSLQLYVGKDGRLWHFVYILGGNIKDYSETIWDKVRKFLSSSTGRAAILATNCRYEAATVIKKLCLKELSLGEILQILHMAINSKKWIIHQHSGWQPVNITLLETNNPVLAAS